MFKHIVIAIALLGLTACASLPGPVQSGYLTTVHAGFQFDRNARGKARYDLILDIKQPVTAEILLQVQYENPVDPSRPVLRKPRLAAGQTRLELTSPLITGLQTGNVYKVTITGLRPGSNDQLFRHVQPIKFEVTPELRDILDNWQVD